MVPYIASIRKTVIYGFKCECVCRLPDAKQHQCSFALCFHINISIERTTQYMAAVLLGGRAHLNWIVSAKIVTYVNNRVINKMDEMQYNIMRNSKLHVYYYTGACTLYSVNQQLSVFSILYSTRT